MIARQPACRKLATLHALPDLRPRLRWLAKSGAFPEDVPVTPSLPFNLPVPPLQDLTDQCVQCGLCLPACPTYALDPIEAESPRGRIALIKAVEMGALAPTDTGDRHLDQCLGCGRCEAVCPAGVAYGSILTLSRAYQRVRRPLGRMQRLAEWGGAHPRALSMLLSAYRQLWPLLPRSLRWLPRPPASSSADSGLSGGEPSLSTSAALFLGCVARSYEKPLYEAVRRLGTAVGMAVTIPQNQTCCGSLHAHGGDAGRADAFAATNRSAFAGAGTVLSLASGCHGTLAGSLHGVAEVRDASAVFAEYGATLRFASRRERVALHLPCTQRNVVRSDGVLRALLARVPELDVIILDVGFGCCGAAGTRMLVDPDRAARLRQPLLDQLAASGATRLLSANIGCRLHLANGTALPVQHPLEFLAECLA